MRMPFKLFHLSPQQPRTAPETRTPQPEAQVEQEEELYDIMTVEIENTNGTTTPTMSSNDTRVYLHYDIDNPPPHPGNEWTRFVCLSDTHSDIYSVPNGDVLLHSGDLSSWGYLPQLQKTMDWLKTLPHPVKIIIAGNHDLCLDDAWRVGGTWDHHTGGAMSNKDVDAAQHMMRSASTRDARIHYLEYESFQFTAPSGRTWDVYGTPACPRYAIGSFQYVGGFGNKEGEAIFAKIPRSTEILLTHTPPYGINDVSKRGKHAGCSSLASRLQSEDLSNCRLHVFGHIHEAYGATIAPSEGLRKERVSVNAAVRHGELPAIVDLLN